MSTRTQRVLELAIPLSDGALHGTLVIPPAASGLVCFVPGDSQHGERIRRLAGRLWERGLATLLFDLLMSDESAQDESRVSPLRDVGLLGRRLGTVTDWLAELPEARGLPVAYLASSTGAAVALLAAARRPSLVRAVISCGGRPDLAGAALEEVRAATLLLVGENDPDGRALNEAAARRLHAHHLVVLPGSHDTLETPAEFTEVTRLVSEWLADHLPPRRRPARRATTSPRFSDRRSAGRSLAAALKGRVGPGAIVLGLPCGGVPVADEVARALGAALDVWVVRKFGPPAHADAGIGAIAEGPSFFMDESAAAELELSGEELESMVLQEAEELRRWVERFRSGPPPTVRGRTVVVIDDGIATGCSTRAVLRAVHAAGAVRVILAVPVASAQLVAALRREADEVVCLSSPRDLGALERWYDDFASISDEEVVSILEARERRLPDTASA